MRWPQKPFSRRIIDREIPADIVYEDDLCLVFRDINPQAPVHLVAIPKKEIPSTDDLQEEDGPLVGHLFVVLRKLAAQLGLTGGYRVVTNCRPGRGPVCRPTSISTS